MKREEPNCIEGQVEKKGSILRENSDVHSCFCFLAVQSKMSGEFARSLGKGTPAPGPVPEGTIRVYSMRHCPFAQRTVLVLKAKGINHEIVNINLRNKPEWFLEKNPLGMVPVLETSKGQLINESPITCEYLDEVYPEKKLYPADPYEKAYQKMLLECFSKLHPICFNHIRSFRNGEDASALKNEFQEKLLKLEEKWRRGAYRFRRMYCGPERELKRIHKAAALGIRLQLPFCHCPKLQ